MKKDFESGRSMVEMLGTLAIIGVLSIGGIAGYSYGMDKYRCNKTMNDISLRTVDLMTQASQGRTTLSLSEWANESTIYDFSNPAYSDDNLIMFDVGVTEKIPQGVCQMVFEGLSNIAVQIDINESPATSKDSCGEDNTMTFYFEGGGTGTGDNSAEKKCASTVCGTCQKCENETCVTVADYEMACTTNGQTGWCVSGSCQASSCDCGPNQYCADHNTSCEQANPGKGCVDLKFKEVEIDGTTYYVSNDYMSWWDAVSACEALGNKKLLTVKDILVLGDDDMREYMDYNHVKTALGKALYEKVWGSSGYPYIWSSIVMWSCSVYGVYLHNGSFDAFFGRDSHPIGSDYYGGYAVCR
ncbi:MAG: hypothetical protein IJV75_02085 [Alphaproteobacteria bacterium]|nr:hypothetical protein [Alphaproteobacteria bacterium]